MQKIDKEKVFSFLRLISYPILLVTFVPLLILIIWQSFGPSTLGIMVFLGVVAIWVVIWLVSSIIVYIFNKKRYSGWYRVLDAVMFGGALPLIGLLILLILGALVTGVVLFFFLLFGLVWQLGVLLVVALLMVLIFVGFIASLGN